MRQHNESLLVLIIGTLTILYGFFNFIGSQWTLVSPFLLKLSPEGLLTYISLGFTLAGMGLISTRVEAKITKTLKILCGLALIVIAFFTIMEKLVPLQLGLSEGIMKQSFRSSWNFPNNLSVAFLLIGIDFVLLSALLQKPAINIIHLTLVSLIFFLGLVGILSNLLNLKLFFVWYEHVHLGVIPSFIILVFSLGLYLTGQQYLQYAYLSTEQITRKISLASIAILFATTMTVGFTCFSIMMQQYNNSIQQSLHASLRDRNALIQADLNYPITEMNTLLLSSFFKNFLLSTPAQINQLAELFIAEGFSGVSITGPQNEILVQKGKFISAPIGSFPVKLSLPAELVWQKNMIALRLTNTLMSPKGVIKLKVEWPLKALTSLFTTNKDPVRELVMCSPVPQGATCITSVLFPKILIIPKTINSIKLPPFYAFERKSGLRSTVDYRNRRIFGAYAPVGETGLALVYKIDLASVFLNAFSTIKLLFPIIILAILGGIILLYTQVVPIIRRLSYSEYLANLRQQQAQTSKAKLKKITRLQQTLLDNANFTIISCNSHGIIQTFNKTAEQMLGYRAKEVVGKATPLIFHDMDAIKKRALELSQELQLTVAPGLDTLLAKAKVNGVDTHEWEYIKNDGTRIPIQLSISELHDKSGKTTGALITGLDLTDRKRLDRLKNEFISTVSHELRTPLTSIHGSIALLTGGALGELPPETYNLLMIAKNNSERLIRLINDILDVEKIESDKFRFHSEPLMLDELITQAVVEMESFATKHQVDIQILGNTLDAQINGDHDRLLQVLTNLISNAIKFSPKHGIVSIEQIQLTDRIVRTLVSDSGPGIPANFHGRVFQKFAQADSGTTKKYGGTGLGLSISKAIIAKHGGIIHFDSQPHKRTTFYFDLPIAKKAPIVTLTEKPIDKICTILICEADVNIAASFNYIFIENNFHSIVTSNAMDAKKYLNRQNIDIVLLGLDLPDESGIDFIHDIKSSLNEKLIPTILAAAKTNSQKNIIQGTAIHIIDWIEKTINMSQLQNTVTMLKNYLEVVNLKILHVEDDHDLSTIVKSLLKDEGTLSNAASLKQAREALLRNDFDLVILDMKLPDGLGVELIPLISQQHLPVIFFTAYELTNDDIYQLKELLLRAEMSNEELLNTIKIALNAPIAMTIDEKIE
ncbi:MAG: response regulator [Gammaproteobacteria bacterium]|nr:response regulator [Gammaproteobacteria bacterium]